MIALPRTSRLALGGLLVATLGLAACGSDSDSGDAGGVDTSAAAAPDSAAPDSAAPDTAAPDTAAPDAAAPPTDAPAPLPTVAPAAGAAAVACPPTDGSAPQQRTFAAPVPMCIDPAKTYTATVETTKGTFTITFDAVKAPATVNNFVTLARFKYFDGIGFHRVVPGFVIQGGDPEGTGGGGPGYAFADELPQAGEYKVGSVAMANAGPDTNGSQFFVITGEAGAGLPPQYSLFGQVTEGMDVVMAIDALGQGDGPPSEPVTMTKVTITEA